MRTIVAILMLSIGCAPNAQPQPTTPRPSPETGGFQATAQEPVIDWVELGSPRPTAPLQQTLVVSPNVGPIRQLMVKGLSGEPKVSQVILQFSDQQEKSIEVNRAFAIGDGQVIELRESRTVSKITVFIEPDDSGSVLIYGA